MSMAGLSRSAYSRPYLDLTLALLVRDHDRRDFRTRELIDANPKLKIAFPNEPYYLGRAREFLPNAEIIPIDDVRTFLTAKEGEYDALLHVGEILGAFSLVNPQFGVVVPRPSFETVPGAYQLPLGEPEWRAAVDAWIELKRADGTIQRLFDYWALGKEVEVRQPRWSVGRDVLHWID
jgi:ABC-type amino acid transport substrate-binding protein